MTGGLQELPARIVEDNTILDRCDMTRTLRDKAESLTVSLDLKTVALAKNAGRRLYLPDCQPMGVEADPGHRIKKAVSFLL